MDKMKRLLIYYAASALCAVAIISGAILSDRYITSLSNTLNQFQTLQINNFKMKGATKEMGVTLSRVDSMIPASYKSEEMEGAILTLVDSIKSRMKGVNIMVGNFDRKENEVALPVTITGNMGDYAAFVNDLGYLQSMISPFLLIDSVSILKSFDETKEVVIFDIKGIIKIQSRGVDGRA